MKEPRWEVGSWRMEKVTNNVGAETGRKNSNFKIDFVEGKRKTKESGTIWEHFNNKHNISV